MADQQAKRFAALTGVVPVDGRTERIAITNSIRPHSHAWPPISGDVQTAGLVVSHPGIGARIGPRWPLSSRNAADRVAFHRVSYA